MSEIDYDRASAGCNRPVDATRFRYAFRQVPAPVAVMLVATADGATTGITCTSAQSLSADPPMVVVAVDDKTNLVPTIRHSKLFSINYLAADRSVWADAFSARGADLTVLTDVIVEGRTPAPTLATGTTAVFECETASIHRGGDHWIVCGTILHARFQADVEPLLYRAGSYGTFEHANERKKDGDAALIGS